MRNLRNIHRSLWKPPEGPELTASAWDVATDSVICAFGPSHQSTLLELKRWKKGDQSLQQIASWDAPCPLPNLDYDEILNLHYFSDSSTVCLVLAGGDVVIIREDPQPGEEKIEIVGSVDAGISAAAWSPDEELLAITTRAATLLYMTKEFENITDVVLTDDDLKISSHVSVGWGKAETQFKGKTARALRDPTVPEILDEGKSSELDVQMTSISWRGDGLYVSVNSVEPGSRRVIRVFSREGILESVSEPVDGLLGALAWRPLGNLLATIQHLRDHIKVIFFERNGLRHGHFDLRLNDEEIKTWGSNISLEWNADSSVLAVCFKNRVQLWTTSNYHYYLKQEISSLSTALPHKVASLIWHPEKPLYFVLFSADAIQRLAYASVVTYSPTTPPNDYGVIAVIDGKFLKVTPLRLANVPPPMALHQIILENKAIDVAITTDSEDSSSIRIAVLHQAGVSVFGWPAELGMQEPPILRCNIDHQAEKRIADLMYLQIVFDHENSILLLAKGSEASIIRVINTNTLSIVQHILHIHNIDGFVTSGPYANPTTYLIQNEKEANMDRKTNKSIDEVDAILGVKIALLPFPTPRISAVTCQAQPQHSPNKVSDSTLGEPRESNVFSLDENGTLFTNDRRLLRNCTSYLVTPAHLIFTTSQHLLKFVHMTEVFEDLGIPPDTPESDERCRSIERGARLVAVMPSIFALVLQMPRGNLETIYPRALVLAGIRDSIEKLKYKKAFLACRNHRVDMNILHDHAPEQFISNVNLFVQQVKRVEHVDLFLSQLREEDVSKTMYRETLNKSRSLDALADARTQLLPLSDNRFSKVNRICDAFLDVLRSRTSTHVQNIITAHVCKIPPDLDTGLTQIAALKINVPELADAAIEHICFLADENRLYDNALGLYDLDMALMVAQQSQKDPKEYLPFLQNLQSLPVLRRQYTIDDHLGRFSKALAHLCDLGAFDEVKIYTVKHSIYSEALEHYRYQEEKLKELLRLYAGYLHQEGSFAEAGTTYEYLSDYESASESFRLAHLWKESLSCATICSLSQSKVQSLAQTLAETLIESKDYSSAATIYLDYLSDLPTAARLFCKGYHFAEALRIIGLHRRLDLLESVIDVGLTEGMASMTDLLADCKSQLHAQIPRIRELRVKKTDDPLAFFEGDLSGGVDIPDNLSLAPTDASTTGGSLFTRYTNQGGTVGTNATRRTSKNSRREERKRARGKKGSVYEEEYLVSSVGRLIGRVNSVNEEVQRLIVGLMRRGMRERAWRVETAMTEVVELCTGCIGEVFQECAKEAHERVEKEGKPRGGESVLWDTFENGKPREPPVVKEFAALSLLGR